jgi:drug/metabolite transporter (DMT)-like permease
LPGAVPEHAAMAILYLGLFGTVVGFNLFYYVLKHISAGAISLITLMTPVLALFLGIQFNGEVITLQVWTGAVLILAGLLSYQFGGRLTSWVSGKCGDRLIQPEEVE